MLSGYGAPMDAPLEKPPVAWQPITARGVAAFSRASWGRLFLVQFIVALIARVAVVGCVHGACFPAIAAAIRQLPAQAEIRSGKLNWPADAPAMLAENR